MSDFTFGQVEATLATINGIADHKRVAFSGRLKFLQKNGLPERVLPGRGKAGTFNFSHLMQLALGVELLKCGLTPQRAASLIVNNWGSIRGSAYLATFTESEILENNAKSDVILRPPSTEIALLVRYNAIADLTQAGEGEYDDMEAVDPMPYDKVAPLLKERGTLGDVDGRHALVINLTTLTQAIIFVVCYHSKFSTLEAARGDLHKELEYIDEAMASFSEEMKNSAPLSDEKKSEVAARLDAVLSADYSTNPPTPYHVLLDRARSMMPRISVDAKNFLLTCANLSGAKTFAITDELKRGAAELTAYDVFENIELKEGADASTGTVTMQMTAFGIAAVNLVRNEGI